MMLTLIVSLAIVALGLAGLFNMDRANRLLDDLLKGFGKMTRDVLKYSLLGLAALLWVAAVYSVYVYATEGFAPTIPESLDVFVDDVQEAADRAGDQAKRLLGGAEHGTAYADVRGLKASENLVEPGHSDAAPVLLEHKMGPNISDVMSGVHGGLFERYHSPRFHVGGDECSRTIKDSGNCWGVSRHFVDDQHVNRCNKIFVRAPQALPGAIPSHVRFAL